MGIEAKRELLKIAKQIQSKIRAINGNKDVEIDEVKSIARDLDRYMQGIAEDEVTEIFNVGEEKEDKLEALVYMLNLINAVLIRG